ncbi:hypothetical protein D5086_008289 [Populus alba]|uniref:Uncharacterized protein n=2 Tax=Populus alba TaxID=43335 RepID=A0ACC4CGR0_POPAL|nr:hypothetical protein D5086_0000187420 [Populus alba]
MAGREVREYTNLTDPKDKKSLGKGGRDKVIDDEDITFHRMVAKMQEVAGERGGYLHGRGALDSDDLLYLKEQMEAEEDAERLLRRTEKRAFAAFKISFLCSFISNLFPYRLLINERSVKLADLECPIDFKGALLWHSYILDSSPASVPLSFRVEPKPKSGIRQQDLLKKVVEVKPKRPKVSNSSDGNYATPISSDRASDNKIKVDQEKKEHILPAPSKPEGETNVKNEAEENPVKSLLGLAYASSDEEED